MIIDQVEALKTWLTNKLSPICDAEPIALAKYVCALLKKNKPEQDLRDICVDQLDVFLQQKTKSFVEELFEVLLSKAYITEENENKPPKPVPVAVSKHDKSVTPSGDNKDKVDGQKKRTVTDVSSTTDEKDRDSGTVLTTQASTTPTTTTTASGHKEPSSYPHPNKDPVKESKDTSLHSGSRDVRDRDRERERERGGSRDRRDSWKDERKRDDDRSKLDERNKVDEKSRADDKSKTDERTRDIRDARDIIRERENRDRGDTREVREPRDREARDRDFRRRRSRSRSFSPRRREYDERRRRYDERPPRYSPERRWARRRSWSRSPRRNRSPLDRGPRLRSRSPRQRSRSPRFGRPLRSRSRSRSPRRARSWSRPSSPNKFRSLSPSNARQPDSRGSTPTQDNDYSTLISSSTNDLPAVTSTVGLRPVGEDGRLLPLGEDVRHVPAAITIGGKSRCQNFEEKGYCVLGDVCPYDHGSDPVVVEDVSIPAVLPGSSATGSSSGGAGFVTPDLRVPPPGHLGMRINIGQATPSHVEPYLPEAPGMQGPPRGAFIRGPPPLHQPPPGMMLNRGPPPDPFFGQRREVVMNRPPPPGIDEEDLFDTLASDKESSRVVIPAKRPYSAIDSDPHAMVLGPPPPRMAHVNQHHHMFGANPPVMQQPLQLPAPHGQPPLKKAFDFGRLGNRGGFRPKGPRQLMKTGNLTLEVRKIPPDMNNIAKLNEHFGKFGTLTNIQVKYQGDPAGALISFSNNGEATAAYRSPEPVFNNRFIKLFWHNPERAAEFDMEKEVGGGNGSEANEVVMQTTTVTGGRVGDGINHPSLMLPVRPTIPPAHKLQFVKNKPKAEAAPVSNAGATPPAPGSASSEKSIVYTSSVGNLKKTVFNPTASTPTPASPTAKSNPSFVSPTAVKTADYVSRMEAIKRAEEEKKVATVKQAELDQKRQELLAKQIQQQKVLLETLEKKKATMSETERKSLLQSLRAISDAIDKVKYGTGSKGSAASTPGGAAAYQQPSAAQFKFVSQEQSRKDQLDRELDGMTQQKRQEEVNALRAACASYSRGRGWAPNRGAWSARARGRGGSAFSGRTNLDNRPKTLEVKGFSLSELEEVKAHFQRFGEIDKVDIIEEVPSAFLTFSTRPAAEMAVAHGAKFKQNILVVRWNQFTPKIRTDSTQSSEVDEDLTITLGSLDDESLLGLSGDEKSISSLPQDSSLPTEDDLEPGLETLADDSRAVVADTPPTEAVSEGKTAPYMRSLEEDLLMGDEHFKASYTDDEDEEDHITVTVSNTPSVVTSVYTEAAEDVEMEETFDPSVEDEEDLANLENTSLDYVEDGSWS